MSESIRESEKHGPPPHHPVVTILMNNAHTVRLPDKHVTGIQIKEAAIAQGVPIQLDFVLFRLAGHTQHPVRDDDKVTIHDGEQFRCVDNDDNSLLSPEVEQAIQELRESFPGQDLSLVDDGQGGARVTMQAFATGAGLKPETTWVGFAITFQYPAADVYPHFVRSDLTRSDGRALEGQGLSMATWEGAPALQLSRRSNRWRQGQDTAAIKLAKVIEWLRTR